jgi:hypothetical protein
VSVTAETGVTRRFQVLPPFAFCRDPCCTTGQVLAGADLHDVARRHAEATGHQVTVRQSTDVTWAGPPVPDRAYDVRRPRGRGAWPGELLGSGVTGDAVNELLDEHGPDLEITVHPDLAVAAAGAAGEPAPPGAGHPTEGNH